MHTIDRFVILLNDRTSKCMDIDKTRKKLFANKNNVHLILPTKAALEEHVKRAAYQQWPCVGPDTATGTGAASINQLGLGQE